MGIKTKYPLQNLCIKSACRISPFEIIFINLFVRRPVYFVRLVSYKWFSMKEDSLHSISIVKYLSTFETLNLFSSDFYKCFIIKFRAKESGIILIGQGYKIWPYISVVTCKDSKLEERYRILLT